MSEQTGMETQFSCALIWGRDPKIRLQGVVTQLSAEWVTVVFAKVDRQLLPDIGRRISLEIDWVRLQTASRKQLVCRGTAMRFIADEGTTRVICSLRTSRFRDLRGESPKPTDSTGRSGSDWKM